MPKASSTSLKWVVYYDNELKVSDKEGDISSIPPRGVICISQEDESVGRVIISQNDYYWWDNGWFGGDIFGLWDYLCRSGMKRVLFGRTVSNKKFESIMETARSDDYLPKKSAIHGYRER